MSREDRRPLSQVPEDSVFRYMQTLSPAPTPILQEPFTLDPPFNPTGQNFFDDTYFSSNADDTHPGYHLPLDWAHYQPTHAQDLIDVPDTYDTYLSSEHYPESLVHAPLVGPDYTYLSSEHFPESLIHAPLDVAAHTPFLPPAQSDPYSNPDLPYCEAPFHNPDVPSLQNPDQLTSVDVNSILNFPEYFPEFFSGTRCREEPAAMIDPSDGTTPFPPPQPSPAPAPQGKRRAARRTKPDRTPPMPTNSGFRPSDPSDLSTHEKKRLYVECLEDYVLYLHELFKEINLKPVPLDRVSKYDRGLTTRSIRTILIHLGKSTDTIHRLVTQQEEKLTDLTLRQVWSGAAMCSDGYDNPASPSSSSSAGTSSSAASADADADTDDMFSFFVPNFVLAPSGNPNEPIYVK
ncbi:hypothetical protein K438DRAFT_629168 [Mycena galopus ATCC 62051]|nr:hypothetical protein K438DRAFT_629168 [Mycena galopus ATCC 62051]